MIKSIKISNYKNLDGFEFDGFGRLNLITGKNNVGKTNLLEAMYLGLDKMNALRNIYIERNSDTTKLTNSFTNLDLKKNSLITINNKTFDLKAGILEFTKTNVITILETNLIYISSNQKLDGEILAEYFSEIIKKNKKNDLIKCLKVIDNEIEDIQILVDNKKANIYLIQNNLVLPISFFGDAIKSIFNIFSRILASENKTILIDEIENGIHYENQKEFWSKLLEISKITNCQIIATTHSIEMIKYFYEVTKDEENCKLLTLIKDRKNRMKFQEKEKGFIEYQLAHIKNIEETSVLR